MKCISIAATASSIDTPKPSNVLTKRSASPSESGLFCSSRSAATKSTICRANVTTRSLMHSASPYRRGEWRATTMQAKQGVPSPSKANSLKDCVKSFFIRILHATKPEVILPWQWTGLGFIAIITNWENCRYFFDNIKAACLFFWAIEFNCLRYAYSVGARHRANTCGSVIVPSPFRVLTYNSVLEKYRLILTHCLHQIVSRTRRGTLDISEWCYHPRFLWSPTSSLSGPVSVQFRYHTDCDSTKEYDRRNLYGLRVSVLLCTSTRYLCNTD